MRKKILLFCSFLAISVGAFAQNAPIKSVENPVEWVNTLMGTDSEYLLSNGNTYPAVALPWGMNFWTPQTGKMGNGWAYTYNSYKIRGIKQTHQPSPWINDYGQFSILPTVGEKVFDEEKRASWFSHKAETATPYYYNVYLADYDVVAEITPTERAAQFRVTYPETDSARLVIDAFNGGSYIKVDKENRRVVGYTTKNSGGVPENFKNWFVIELDKEFSDVDVWCDSTLYSNKTEFEGNHVGAIVSFNTKRGEKVNARVASSFISLEQAQISLDRELGANCFEQTKQEGYDIWNKELSRVTVNDGQYADIKVFYSSLYRLLLFPRKFYEIDENDNIIHYSPYNGEVLPGYMFTDNGFWDTFRAVFPFFTLAYPTLTSQIMEGLENTYKESGWLPEWASPGHRDCMIGSNSSSIIASAYLHAEGEKNYDVEKLFEAMVHSGENEGPLSSVGRRGAPYYNELGYVPYDVKIRENVARTLEYAYADYAIMRLAEKMGKPNETIDLYKSRSQNYKNVFDKETSMMRGRNENGEFQSPFNPFKWGDAFTEGNAWHYTWSVFHDIEGLSTLMGGRDKMANMLDSMFSVPPVFDNSYYGFTIHEIREMQIMNMGNYAHGNQPVQHAIYLYNYLNQPWKTQQRVREVMTKLYSAAPDGYCGDEDNGQTSAWFVFSAMGFYPVCPVDGEYVIGSPLFGEVKFEQENGNVFTILAENNSPENVYIQSVTLNGEPFDLTYLTHKQINEGGELKFIMGNEPNYSWGVGADSVPMSMTK
ncbi:MAG: GH92 family glycosyl hydrolase [Rikenellaceae bacterium]